MKNIVILGSTGSVGTQALEIISNYPDEFKIVGLSAGKNISLLKEQIEKFKPEIVSVADEESSRKLRDIEVPVFYGEEGLIKVATCKNADIILTAVVGSVGLLPTIEAIKSGKDIALANKETLVVAGEFVMDLAKKNNVKIIPVDSEHSAIFQCLVGEDSKNIERIILTCSGGSFFGKTSKELENVSVDNALKHPNWNMGAKITIDSATLMNKGLEIIEAHHLFEIPYEKIEVVIHRQSLIHSIVEFCDGNLKAQLGVPDMKLPILYALTYPERIESNLPKINFSKLKLDFEEPDVETFTCLNLAIEAGKKGNIFPCVLNASNEIAVEYFLKKKINFLEIPKIIDYILSKFEKVENLTIEKIIEIDKEVKKKTRKYIEDTFIK